MFAPTFVQACRRLAPGWMFAPAAARSASSCLAQRRTNALDDDRQSADDELVGKSKNTKPCESEPCHASRSAFLTFGSAVVSALGPVTHVTAEAFDICDPFYCGDSLSHIFRVHS
jgi:hypothetical protein